MPCYGGTEDMFPVQNLVLPSRPRKGVSGRAGRRGRVGSNEIHDVLGMQAGSWVGGRTKKPVGSIPRRGRGTSKGKAT